MYILGSLPPSSVLLDALALLQHALVRVHTDLLLLPFGASLHLFVALQFPVHELDSLSALGCSGLERLADDVVLFVLLGVHLFPVDTPDLLHLGSSAEFVLVEDSLGLLLSLLELAGQLHLLAPLGLEDLLGLATVDGHHAFLDDLDLLLGDGQVDDVVLLLLVYEPTGQFGVFVIEAETVVGAVDDGLSLLLPHHLLGQGQVLGQVVEVVVFRPLRPVLLFF